TPRSTTGWPRARARSTRPRDRRSTRSIAVSHKSSDELAFPLDEPSRRMRVLVTGGAGFIGSHIVDALVAVDHDVTVLDDLDTGFRENVNARARLVIGS